MPWRREDVGALRVCGGGLLALRGWAGGFVRVSGLAGRVRDGGCGGAAARWRRRSSAGLNPVN